MNKQKIISSYFREPHFNNLKKVSPRIECFDGKEWKLAGSGILFKGNDQYYVITAAHCICEDNQKPGRPHVQEDRLRIVLSTSSDMAYNVVKVVKYSPEDEHDFAMLSVDFIKGEDNDFDYSNDIKFIGVDIDTHGTQVAIFGHDAGHLTGHRLLGRYVADLTYRLDDHITADGKDLAIIKGFSGGGIFTEYNSVLYCMGYVKGILCGQKNLDDIEIRHIPDLGIPSVWMNHMPDKVNKITESYGNNKSQQDYYQAWRNLYNFLSQNIEDDAKYLNLLNEIEKCRELYPRPKSIAIQDSVERLLFYRHSNFPGRTVEKDEPKPWTENDKKALALVMRDMGTWPSLYAYHQNGLEDLGKKEYIQPLLQRATTISEDAAIENFEPDVNQDCGRYELIMRAAFSFDFKRMKELVDTWEPKTKWLYKKVMLESLWYLPVIKQNGIEEPTVLSDDLVKIKTAIDSGVYNNEDKFIACIIYNCCKRAYPKEIGYEEFHVAGINSPAEVISHIGNNIDRVFDKPIPYGIYTNTIYGSVDTDSFPESLRIIQYLIDSGLLSSTGFEDIVRVDIWMKVFRHLFHNFPGASIFYTLAFANDKLSTLCGQNIAFSSDVDFGKTRDNILVKLLNSIECDETPGRFYKGLYLISMELFPTSDTSIWFDSFKSAVVKTLSTIEVERLSVGDNITRFIGEGILHLKKTYQKKEILSIINNYFEKNPLIFSYILSWSMSFDNNLVADEDVSLILDSIIEKYPLSKTYRILRSIDSHNCLSENSKKIIEAKLSNEGFGFAKDNIDALILLSGLVADQSNIDALKNVILESWNGNYWDCGISGNTFSSRGYLHLDQIDDKIVYSDDELNVIMSNMESNIEIIRQVHHSELFASHISHHVADLLLAMKRFIYKSNVKARINYEAYDKEIDSLILNTFKETSIIGLLSSGEFHDVKNAISLLHQLIKADNIAHYHSEIQFIINLCLLKVNDAIELSVDFISYLVKEFTQYMKSEFGFLLKLIIRNYVDFDYENLHVHALNVRQNLKQIDALLNSEKPQLNESI